MCGKQAEVRQPVTRNPVEEQMKADATAQMEANQQIAAQRKRRQRSSLLSQGGAGSGSPTYVRSLLATGSNPGG